MSVLLVIVVGLWFMSSNSSDSLANEQRGPETITGSGILDGMTFTGKLGPAGKPADVDDTFVFKDGMFVSMECEKNCNYPARPYFARNVEDTVEFISETRCPDNDAKIIWKGSIENNTIQGVFTWTISRWYWTVQKDFRFSGRLSSENQPIA